MQQQRQRWRRLSDQNTSISGCHHRHRRRRRRCPSPSARPSVIESARLDEERLRTLAGGGRDADGRRRDGHRRIKGDNRSPQAGGLLPSRKMVPKSATALCSFDMARGQGAGVELASVGMRPVSPSDERDMEHFVELRATATRMIQ